MRARLYPGFDYKVGQPIYMSINEWQDVVDKSPFPIVRLKDSGDVLIKDKLGLPAYELNGEFGGKVHAKRG